MKIREQIKKSLTFILDFIFFILYVGITVIAILDIFGICAFINNSDWTKILVMVFSSVGLVTLADKRKISEKIEPEIKQIGKNQTILNTDIDKIKNDAHIALNKLDSTLQIEYFSNKTQLYLYLTSLLLQLPSGAQIDVTSFEKNYNVSYDVGEDRHIESFMKTWTKLVKGGHLSVRQLVHVTSPQDYKELKERIENFKNNFNFTVSAIVGLPIVPFIDYMIINQEYVFIGFSNDVSSPYNFSYGLVIKGKEVALNFQNHFNIYWSNQFSFLIKDKDEIKFRTLNKLESFVYDIDHNVNLMKYNYMMLELYHINECNKTVIPLLENLHSFYGNSCCEILQNDIEKQILQSAEFVRKQTHDYVIFERKNAADLLAKMMFNARKKIYAVSLDIDETQFWLNSEGETTFQANIDVITKQRVHIERIFVCTKEKKAELETIMQEQSEAGIDIYYTEYKKGMGGKYEDFMIVDNEAVLVFEERNIKISINRQHIEDYYKKYKRIRNMGTDYKRDRRK